MTDHAGQMADAAREWLDRFERETGKTIRDGNVAIIDVCDSLTKAIQEWELKHVDGPGQIRVARDVMRQLETEFTERRVFLPDAEKYSPALARMVFWLGVPVVVDAELPSCAIVAEAVI